MEMVKDEWCCESKNSSGRATVVEYGTTPMLGVVSEESRGSVAIVVRFGCVGYCCGLYCRCLYCCKPNEGGSRWLSLSSTLGEHMLADQCDHAFVLLAVRDKLERKHDLSCALNQGCRLHLAHVNAIGRHLTRQTIVMNTSAVDFHSLDD